MIDYHSCKLPYEVAIRHFKEQSKLREQNIAQELKKASQLTEMSQIQQLVGKQIFHNQKENIQNIKNQLDENYKVQKQFLDVIQFRIKQGVLDNEVKLQRSVVDYLIRQGYVGTALKLIQEYNIENYTQIELEFIQYSNQIIKDMKNKSIKMAFEWCEINKGLLKKTDNDFLNNLIFQNYIELIKVDQYKAIQYIRSNQQYFNQAKLQQAMGCLIINKNLEYFQQYQKLFSDHQWIVLIKEFKEVLSQTYFLLAESTLESHLKCGISSLKTIYCCQKEFQKLSQCPICNLKVQKLSDDLITTQKLGSTWICRLSGEIMDENNPPLMLPNCGQVYSQKALIAMASRMNGVVIDPVTKKEYKLEECQKVFLA